MNGHILVCKYKQDIGTLYVPTICITDSSIVSMPAVVWDTTQLIQSSRGVSLRITTLLCSYYFA